MKKKNLLFVFCFAGTITFSSCEKNLYDESKQPEKEKQVSDLNIPADFDWKLSKNTQCYVTSNIATDVDIFMDEACNENSKLATITTDVEGETPLPLSIPTYVEKLYLKYNNGKTISASTNVNGDFSFTITDAEATTTSRSATTRADDNYKPTKGVIYYPSNGWGTIMFEDEFPSLGDYDFNDFVVNYKVQLQDLERSKNKYTAQVIQVGLRLKAIGGVLPYSPYLRLKQVDKDLIEDIEIIETSNIAKNISFPITEDKKGKAIIDFSALKQFSSPNVNAQYFNTTEDNRIEEKDLPSINIVIYLNAPVLAENILDNINFDFFLADKNGKEVHMNGFSPINYEYPSNNNELLSISGNDDNYYFNKNRLIWGLKVPASISHTIEKANFLKAYKNFDKWAESNGQNSQNWYGQGNKNDDLLID